MALAGRKPQPAALKLLKGRSPGKDSGDRPVKAPPSFVRLAPEPPTWLTREAKAEWRRVVPELARLRLLKQGSRGALASYCEVWSLFVEAVQERRTGLVIDKTTTRRNGDEVTERVPNPAVAIMRDAQRELRQWVGVFGLDPTSEGRLNVPEAGDDGAEDFD